MDWSTKVKRTNDDLRKWQVRTYSFHSYIASMLEVNRESATSDRNMVIELLYDLDSVYTRLF